MIRGLAGRLGIHKTPARIRQSYYWPGLQSVVHSYIAGREVCTKRKAATQTNKAPMHLVYSGYPMERFATDLLGELPMTSNGNKYILVVADYFTKWTESFALPNILAETVATKIVEEVVSRFGVPAIIHSDQGPQYESNCVHCWTLKRPTLLSITLNQMVWLSGSIGH